MVKPVESNNKSDTEVLFPERVYTAEEIQLAQRLISQGYKHKRKVVGSDVFRKKVERILGLIRVAGYQDFFRTYIRSVVEIDGIGQLREYEATIWANAHNVDDPVEGARFLVQKAYQMKSYLEAKPYHEYGETVAIQKSLEFLEDLKNRCEDDDLKGKCEKALKVWRDYGPM